MKKYTVEEVQELLDKQAEAFAREKFEEETQMQLKFLTDKYEELEERLELLEGKNTVGFTSKNK